jgi:hypothetical protein
MSPTALLRHETESVHSDTASPVSSLEVATLHSLADFEFELMLWDSRIRCSLQRRYTCRWGVLSYRIYLNVGSVRVSAVYENSEPVTIIFGILWAAVFGSSFLFLLAAKGTHIGPTQSCINTSVSRWGPAPVFINFILNTLVCIAISLRITSYSIGRISLPAFLKSLVQGGQLYYLFVTKFSLDFIINTHQYSFPLQFDHSLQCLDVHT